MNRENDHLVFCGNGSEKLPFCFNGGGFMENGNFIDDLKELWNTKLMDLESNLDKLHFRYTSIKEDLESKKIESNELNKKIREMEKLTKNIRESLETIITAREKIASFPFTKSDLEKTIGRIESITKNQSYIEELKLLSEKLDKLSEVRESTEKILETYKKDAMINKKVAEALELFEDISVEDIKEKLNALPTLNSIVSASMKLHDLEKDILKVKKLLSQVEERNVILDEAFASINSKNDELSRSIKTMKSKFFELNQNAEILLNELQKQPNPDELQKEIGSLKNGLKEKSDEISSLAESLKELEDRDLKTNSIAMNSKQKINEQAEAIKKLEAETKSLKVMGSLIDNELDKNFEMQRSNRTLGYISIIFSLGAFILAVAQYL